MDADQDEDQSFGQIQPPLYQLIKDILRGYPSGQIFKEIIQNADDAQATAVKFYLDCRKRQTLPPCFVNGGTYDEPERFDGPALMSFNNAPFTQEDWKGIQRLHDSGKAKNPFKVGKFGIGFNSVYHITDLPVIISEKYCGYLEPQKDVWKGKSGQKYFLENLDKSWVQDIIPHDLSNPSQCTMQSSLFTSKTLLRFPLRRKSSKISDEIWSVEKLRQLLQVIKEEAKYLLLFLQSVRSIEVIEIMEQCSKTTFEVSLISHENLEHQKSLFEHVRTTFKDYFKGNFAKEQCIIKRKSHFKVRVNDGNIINMHEWIVVHRVGSENPEVLELAEQQNVLPWVGIALEFSQEPNVSGGRLFCFLPLPLETKVPFSVHINGTFAVSSNRRHLCWKSQDRQNNREAKWNECLIERCIPECYMNLMEEVVRVPSLNPEVVYNCWPVISRVRGTLWEGMLKPFFDKFLHSDAIVHTISDNGQWVSIQNSVFALKDEDVPSCVKQALTVSATKVVEIGDDQWAAVEKYYMPSNRIKIIKPSLVKAILKLHPESYKFQSYEFKCSLLKYCLANKHYSDLVGLELIPLVDKSFSTFKNTEQGHGNPQHLYVCTSENCHRLLPGLDNIMVDLLEQDPSIHSLLACASRSSTTQLKLLTECDVASLVSLSNPQYWSQEQFKTFWRWLHKYDLNVFLNLQIIPVKNSKNLVTIQHLNKNSSLVFVSHSKALSQKLRDSLEKFGINLACESDFPYLSHPQFENYMYQLEPADVLDALSLSKISNVQLSNEQSQAVQEFLLGCDDRCRTKSRVKKICEMKIFTVLQETDTLHSINQLKTKMSNRALVQGEKFYLKTGLLPNQPMIFNGDQRLLAYISDHVKMINEVECLESVIFPSIRDGQMSDSSISEIMTNVLDYLKILIQKYPHLEKSLIGSLSSLQFVMTEPGQRKPPSSLFDPDCELLTELYKGEPVFPSGEFVKYTDKLRLCGLRPPESVTAMEIYQIVSSIQSNSSLSVPLVQYNENIYYRVVSIFKFLAAYPQLLDEKVNISSNSQKYLKVAIAEISKVHALLPVLMAQPSGYPSCLNWKGSECTLTIFNSKNVIFLLEKEDSRFGQPDPRIIGSEAVFVEYVPFGVIKQLSSSNDELADAVVAHFKHVLEHEMDMEADTLGQIAFSTYEFLCSCRNVVGLNSSDKWVWVDGCSKFVKPSICALSTNSSYKNNLEPFVYVLPEKMKRYKAILCNFGVKESVTTEQILSVLKNIKNRTTEITSSDAWLIVKNVLEWVVETKYSSRDILIPIKCNITFPELHPAEEVSYTDNEMLLEIAKSSDEKYKLVHDSIIHLAPQLRLTPLSDHLDITEEVFEDAGQNESLTTRLRSILNEYKDGLMIIKEMIQNADDAEATEVNILYDARSHTTEELLFKGMADSHGPALIIHNNAKFTEEDFVNITKLAGATKKDKPLKIGKFGVGFCSVYHITDVPSFISNEWLYIFDPMLKHLKDVVKNVNQPGKRVRYLKNFLSCTQQLAPYRDLFGFSSSSPYNGTMFRLPFRKYASEISSKIYSDSSVCQLKNELTKDGKDLLLFLNHVNKLTFWSIKNGGVVPSEEISFVKTVRGNQVKIETYSSQCQTSVDYWIMSCHKEKLSTAFKKQQMCISSVACKLKYEFGSYEVIPVDGSVFCFLPLPVSSTGLPVHINANFAVMGNRRDIWINESSVTPLDPEESWNKLIMEVAIPQAYCSLLLSLKEMHSQQLLKNYDFFSIWPLASNLTMIRWIQIFRPFYQKVLTEDLLYSISVSCWKKMKEIKFLEESILVSSNEFNNERARKCVIKALSVLQLPIIYLPIDYINDIQKHLTNDLPFISTSDFMDAFLKNLKLFEGHVEDRNEIMYFALHRLNTMNTDEDHSLLDQLKSSQCIPCTPDGQKLKYCNDIVDPRSRIGKLFVPEDSMFPFQKFYSNKNVKEAMIKLGMLKCTLPWDILVRCAKKVEHSYGKNKEHTLDQIVAIIECVGKNIKKKEMLGYQHKDNIELLKSTRFLPVLQRPECYSIDWKGDGHNLSSPLECMYVESSEVPFAIGSQQFILNCDCIIDDETLKFLQIQTRPLIKDVLSHFEYFITKCETQSDNKLMVKEIEKTCQSVYSFLEEEIKKQCFNIEDISSTDVGKRLSGFYSRHFVWSGREFVCPTDISDDWTIEGPYLFKIPDILAPSRLLIRALNIQRIFSAPKLIGTLERMFNDFGKVKIPESYHPILDRILIQLNDFTEQDFKQFKEKIYLPSIDYTLHHVEDLSFDDTQWIKPDDSEKCVFVHNKVLRSTALNLGIKPYRTRYLDHFSDSFPGDPFGQKEKLTLRIRNIIRDYPLDITFLKELLQNADDAEATKMYVILDKREHGKKCILSEEWEELQGPALLVWNNKDFTNDHLEGIQQLGHGSKGHDSESIGQFGIGFNVVYHITDCPSLITKGSTLCVFDPHCRYVPGANASNPGRCFRNMDEKFWEKFSDLSSPYFFSQSVPNQPEGLSTGSLFRFPLRCTIKQVESSELVEDKINSNVINTEVMERYLDSWIDDIKDTLLFLNHLISFKMFIVDEKTNTFHTKLSYDIETNRTVYHDKLKEYLRQHQPIPFVVSYPLTMSAIIGSKRQSSEEWLIQQGIGNMDSPQQIWSPVEKILPKHGIAAPLGLSHPLNGKLFCFLPLPGNSSLPVHVNGQFILNNNRRALWSGQESDKKVKWNNNILKAICSSYIHFLTKARSQIISTEGYPRQDDFRHDCEKYYSLFPYWLKKNTQTNLEIDMNRESKRLAKCFFKKLLDHNCEILVCETRQGDRFFAEWHCLKSNTNQFQQVYFCPDSKINVLPLLEKIKMKFTCAPIHLCRHLEETSRYLTISPSAVFTFFTKFHSKIFTTKVPCHIKDSPFKEVGVFISFLSYITRGKLKTQYTEFVKTPCNHPFLLTADNILRPFEKVVYSKYHHVFPNSLSVFIHEECFSLNLNPEYFHSPESAGFSTLEKLFNDNFSTHLQTQEVKNTIISSETLEMIWECIRNDRLFKYNEQTIVEKWAILPADNGYLYNAVSPIKPIIPDSSDDWNDVVNVFRQLGVPIFTENFDEIAEKYCLNISVDFDKVLLALCEQQKRNVELGNLITPENSTTLLSYFSRCSFRHNKSILEQILSLPIFMDVNGNLTTLLGKDVYLWPSDSFRKAGYDEWAPKNEVVFLEKEGSWSHLCQSDFSVLSDKISTQDVYTELIFKKFHLLTPEERKDHLLYIRDFVHPDAYNASKNESVLEQDKKTAAVKFLTQLSQLECLEHEEHSNELSKKCFEPEAHLNKLLPISSFSDHTIEIFSTFADSFLLLSAEFKDKAWMKFFRQLKLRTEVTFDEYLKFCRKVAAGQHKDLRQASKVLVDYFFSRSAEPWYSKEEYLDQIKDICFIVTNDLKELSSLKAPNQTRSFFPKLGLHLTSFDGTATEDCASLVWTVKPIVSLPEISQTAKDKNILHELGVTTLSSISASEIYQNVINISTTRFANFELFQTYNIQCGGVHIVEIMVENIGRLYELDNEESYLKKLKGIQCIPVFADLEETKPVLVKSFQVVKSTSDKSLWPYVCTIPNDLKKISAALDLIGVEQLVSLKHVQYILQFAFNAFVEQPILPNEAKIFRACVLKLFDLLQSCLTEEQKANAAEALKPLYLPSIQNNSLLPISSLLFMDCNRYKKHVKSLKLDGTGYSLFHIPRPSSDDINRFTEKDVCLCLPKEVRPKGLSFVCTESVELVNEVSSPEASLYNHFIALKQLSSSIGDVLEKVLTKRGKKSEEYIKEFINCFGDLLLNMKLLQCSNLKAVVSINKKKIGCIKESYVLLDSTPCTLYIDSQASSGGHVVWKDISHSFCLQIARALKLEKKLSSFLSFTKDLCSCLKCRSVEDLREVLEENEISNFELDEVDVYASRIELGVPIPEDLHPYLDNDFSNILRPQEWVGYEVYDGYYIWAMILYRIENGSNTENPLSKRYKIIINEGDEEGRDVSMLDLYKLIYRKDSFKTVDTEKALAMTEEVGMASDVQKISDCLKLKTLKQQICDELRQTWKLPEKEKRKALRRLCYKYHPDKVVNTEEIHLYEEAFKFLQNQIDRLEANQELEDPNDVSNDSESKPSSYHSHWREDFTHWEENIQTSKRRKKKRTKKSSQADESPINIPQIEPNTDEAKRWLRQAECDYEALLVLQSAVTEGKGVSCQALFMAHEVMEKGLKAAMYALLGLSPYFLKIHDLTPLANAVLSEVPTATQLVMLASKMESYYLDTRFPNRYRNLQTAPVDVYTPVQSKNITDCTTNALRTIKEIVVNHT